MPETMTVNDLTYIVLRLLGKGKGGYSYLVEREGKQYTLKQIHHEPCDYYTFGDKLASELRDYETLGNVGIPMPRLLAVDHGRERILKEFIDGPSVFELVRDGCLEPSLFAQMEAMCVRLYPAGLNIDYFPTNFILQEGILWYIDYECNFYDPKWNFENWGVRYWSRTEEFEAYLQSHT